MTLPFERNQHGHYIVTFTGLGLTGAQEIARQESLGNNLGKYFKQCLMSTANDSYDRNHRLEQGKLYTVALMPTVEIERDEDRTTGNLRNRGLSLYGYGKPLAGIVPRIREEVSDEQMEKMDGAWYIAAPHNLVKDSDGGSVALNANRNVGGRWLGTHYAFLGSRWFGGGLFAFAVSQKD